MPRVYSDYDCGTCGRHFSSGYNAIRNHCNDTGHHRLKLYECNICDRRFSSQSACDQHMGDTDHFGYECNVCDDIFPTERKQIQHEHEEHLYCETCDRYFNNSNNLSMHLKSRVHLGSNITCPFCSASHTTATGLVHHLERGGCPRVPDMSRDEMYKFVRSRDTSGAITKNLIGWTGSGTYEATSRTWNGDCYECYLCHRGFSSLRGLNQHLASPIHQQAYYHCFKASCQREFKTLAALMNHLESETFGAMRFEKIQRGAEDFVRSGRLLM